MGCCMWRSHPLLTWTPSYLLCVLSKIKMLYKGSFMCGSILSSSFIRSNVCTYSNITTQTQYLYWYENAQFEDSIIRYDSASCSYNFYMRQFTEQESSTENFPVLRALDHVKLAGK